MWCRLRVLMKMSDEGDGRRRRAASDEIRWKRKREQHHLVIFSAVCMHLITLAVATTRLTCSYNSPTHSCTQHTLSKTHCRVSFPAPTRRATETGGKKLDSPTSRRPITSSSLS